MTSGSPHQITITDTVSFPWTSSSSEVTRNRITDTFVRRDLFVRLHKNSSPYFPLSASGVLLNVPDTAPFRLCTRYLLITSLSQSLRSAYTQSSRKLDSKSKRLAGALAYLEADPDQRMLSVIGRTRV